MNQLFAINRKYIQHLCICLCSINHNGGEEHYDVYILHSDLNQEDIDFVMKEAGKEMTCHFIMVDGNMFDGFPVSGRYPEQIYYRLAAPILLPEHLDRILYLDVELIVINPLKELYETDMNGMYYAACSHVRGFLTKCNQLRPGIRGKVPYINTGVLLMNLGGLREEITMDQIRETTKKKMHTFLLPDQDLITVMYGDRIRLMDSLRYNMSDRQLCIYNANHFIQQIDLEWIRKNTVIIHYYGRNNHRTEGIRVSLMCFTGNFVNIELECDGSVIVS